MPGGGTIFRPTPPGESSQATGFRSLRFAQWRHEHTLAGGDNLTRDFNLTRPSRELEKVRDGYALVIERRKQVVRRRLFRAIDALHLSGPARFTALVIGEDVIWVGSGRFPSFQR